MKRNSFCSILSTSVGAAETVIGKSLLYLCSSKITGQADRHAGKSVGAMTSNLVAKPSRLRSKWRNT